MRQIILTFGLEVIIFVCVIFYLILQK